MNEILKIAEQIEIQKISLCNRCLGRLFGKLGHGLTNTTRGRAIRLLLRLNAISSSATVIKREGESPKFSQVKQMIENFNFDERTMYTLSNVLGEDFQGKLGSNDVKKSKILEDYIKSILEQETDKELKNEECITCSGLFDELPKFADLVTDTVKGYEFNDFLIGCKLDFDQVAAEEELWSKLGTKHPEAMKSEFNRELGKILEARLDKEVNFNTPELTIIVDTRYDLINLQVASLFIYGRYRKLARDLPQTRWPCKRCWGKGCDNCNGTGKIYPTSVEELIAKKVMEKTKGKAHLFHGMGREDIGVRMLGSGRPFILEITEPVYRVIDLKKLHQEINTHTKDRVEVSDLEFTTHRAVRSLKAAKPSKTYNIKVNLEKKVDIAKLKDVISTFSGRTIHQRTPIRVSHRRSDLIRKRIVVEISLTALENEGTTAEIELTGESGLYIKELISGDSGRTTPSLAGELGIECTVSELDVIQINDNY